MQGEPLSNTRMHLILGWDVLGIQGTSTEMPMMGRVAMSNREPSPGTQMQLTLE